VVSNSETGKRQHEQLGYQPRRWAVIPNGFDTELFRPDSSARLSLRKEWQVPDETIVVALVARVDPMKDHATFLDAAQQVTKAGKNAWFLLIGKDTQTLDTAVAVRDLAGHVRLLGYRNKMERLLPGVDILCLSSAFGEGFPNILGEAMACGIPCVSTDVGDARTIIGETGAVVPARNPTALAQAVIDLIDRGAASRESLGRAARSRVEAMYSLPSIVQQYCALYSDLVPSQLSQPSRRRLAGFGQ
jgi:glycosyltransferase involved in cell wall biosynthesis